MKPTTNILFIVLALSSLSFCQMAGGFRHHYPSEDTKFRARNILENISNKENRNMDAFWKQQHTLAWYGTQVVAGINHGMIYHIKGYLDGKNGFHCFKVWEKLDGTYELTVSNTAPSLGKAFESCGLPLNA